MIRSFHDKMTEAVFNNRRPKGFPADLFNATRRKLKGLATAKILDDLKSPQGNRLEALKRDRAG